MKVIDLLNKIAKGEEVPNKIKFFDEVYNYDICAKDYLCEDWSCYFNQILNREGNLANSLNDEVEIIEEDKKIEKMLYIANPYMKDWTYNERIIANTLQGTQEKLNELIDEVNKLKEDK